MKLFPWYIVRKNTLSGNNLSFLSQGNSADKISMHNQIYNQFLTIKEEVVEELEKKFFETKNKKILNIKRKVYNSKCINSNNIPDEIKGSLSKYKAARDKYISSKEKLNIDINNIKDTHRKNLWDIFNAEEVLTNPLPLINYNMKKNISNYLETNINYHKNNHRKLDITLLNILARTVYKTSPFSSFTGIDIKHINESNQTKTLQGPYYTQEINYYIFQKIIEKLSSDKDVQKNLNFTFKGIKNADNNFDFFNRIDINKGKIYKNIENKFTLNNIGVLEKLYIKGKFTYNDMLKIITEFTNDTSKSQIIIDNFISKGIIDSDLEFNEFGKDPFESFYRTLDKMGKSPKVLEITSTMVNIQEKLMLYGNKKYKERFNIYEEIKELINSIGLIIGYDFLKENIFYEDYILNSTTDTLNLSDKEISNFQDIQRFSYLISIPLQFKYELAHQFFKKFGDSKKRISDEETKSLYLDVVMKFDNWSNVLKPLHNLDSKDSINIEKLKKEVANYIHTQKNQNEIVIESSMINEWFELLSKNSNLQYKNVSSTVLFQKDQNKIILNKMYTGNLKLFIRYFKYIDGIYDQKDFKDYVQKSFPRDLYEIKEGFGFNANQHQEFIDNRLLVPGSKLTEEKGKVLSFNDLSFIYNNKTRMLDVIDKNNKNIQVDYIGSLVDYMLPTTMRMCITNLSPRFDADYLNVWEINKEDDRLIIDVMPRLKIDEILVGRKKWLLNNNYNFPEFKSYDEEYIETVKIFKLHNLPLEFFAKSYIEDMGDIDYLNMSKTFMKPLYINLNSPLYFKEFKNYINKSELLIIEECFPKLEDTKYNTEFQIEVLTHG